MNEVAKSRKQNNDKKETNKRIREMEWRTRIQVVKSRDFFDGILLLSLCFLVEMTQETNERILEMKL